MPAGSDVVINGKGFTSSKYTDSTKILFRSMRKYDQRYSVRYSTRERLPENSRHHRTADASLLNELSQYRACSPSPRILCQKSVSIGYMHRSLATHVGVGSAVSSLGATVVVGAAAPGNLAVEVPAYMVTVLVR